MKTINTNFRGTQELEYQIRCQCPYTDMVDDYHVEITLHIDEEGIELDSLRKFLDSFSGEEVSQEDLTEQIYSGIFGQVVGVRIVTKGTHFGIESKCVRET